MKNEIKSFPLRRWVKKVHHYGRESAFLHRNNISQFTLRAFKRFKILLHSTEVSTFPIEVKKKIKVFESTPKQKKKKKQIAIRYFGIVGSVVCGVATCRDTLVPLKWKFTYPLRHTKVKVLKSSARITYTLTLSNFLESTHKDRILWKVQNFLKLFKAHVKLKVSGCVSYTSFVRQDGQDS